PTVGYRDFALERNGEGWLVSRDVFEGTLAENASKAGAEWRWSAPVIEVAEIGNGWRLRVGREETVDARFLIDATGRRSIVARRLGARRLRHAPLLAAVWTRRGVVPSEPGWIDVATTPDGWWYRSRGP